MMKKTIILGFGLLAGLMSVTASAQTRSSAQEYEKVRFGLKVGGQASVISDIHPESKARIPVFTGGVMLQIPLQRTDCRWYLTPELLYSQEGEKAKFGTKNVSFSQEYIAIPVMLKTYLAEQKLIYLEAGPRLSYMVYHPNNAVDLAEPKKLDFSLNFGGGFSFGPDNNYELGARLNWGMLDMYPNMPHKNYNFGGAVTFAYLFGQSKGRTNSPMPQQVVEENNSKVTQMKIEAQIETQTVPEAESFGDDATVLYFDSNRATMNGDESSKIDEAIRFLREHPSYSAYIVGFSGRGYQGGLVQKRVDYVRDYLLITGRIASRRIITNYNGNSSHPNAEAAQTDCVVVSLVQR